MATIVSRPIARPIKFNYWKSLAVLRQNEGTLANKMAPLMIIRVVIMTTKAHLELFDSYGRAILSKLAKNLTNTPVVATSKVLKEYF